MSALLEKLKKCNSARSTKHLFNMLPIDQHKPLIDEMMLTPDSILDIVDGNLLKNQNGRWIEIGVMKTTEQSYSTTTVKIIPADGRSYFISPENTLYATGDNTNNILGLLDTLVASTDVYLLTKYENVKNVYPGINCTYIEFLDNKVIKIGLDATGTTIVGEELVLLSSEISRSYGVLLDSIYTLINGNIIFSDGTGGANTVYTKLGVDTVANFTNFKTGDLYKGVTKVHFDMDSSTEMIGFNKDDGTLVLAGLDVADVFGLPATVQNVNGLLEYNYTAVNIKKIVNNPTSLFAQLEDNSWVAMGVNTNTNLGLGHSNPATTFEPVLTANITDVYVKANSLNSIFVLTDGSILSAGGGSNGTGVDVGNGNAITDVLPIIKEEDTLALNISDVKQIITDRRTTFILNDGGVRFTDNDGSAAYTIPGIDSVNDVATLNAKLSVITDVNNFVGGFNQVSEVGYFVQNSLITLAFGKDVTGELGISSGYATDKPQSSIALSLLTQFGPVTIDYVGVYLTNNLNS